MAQKIYKSPLEQAQADFEAGKISQGQLDDVAIKDFEAKKPVKLISEEEALTPTEEEKAQFKNGQHNLKEGWLKQLDEWATQKPDKKATIDKMRNYDDEQIELARAFMELMGVK